MEQLSPLPDHEGLRKTQELYREKFDHEITEQEAYDILSRVMGYLYALRRLETQAAEAEKDSTE